jgi:hypothetical protein
MGQTLARKSTSISARQVWPEGKGRVGNNDIFLTISTRVDARQPSVTTVNLENTALGLDLLQDIAGYV